MQIIEMKIIFFRTQTNLNKIEIPEDKLQSKLFVQSKYSTFHLILCISRYSKIIYNIEINFFVEKELWSEISLIAHNILHLIWWFFSSPLCFYQRALISFAWALCANDQRIMFDLCHSWVSSNKIKIIGNKPVKYECDFLLFFFCAIQSVQLLNDGKMSEWWFTSS